MLGLIALIIALGSPLAIGLFYRVGSQHIFFSVMAGELLARYFGPDAKAATQSVLGAGAAGYTEVVLLILPAILTGVFLRNNLPRSRTVLHFVPWLITGIVLAAFGLPLLPEAIQDQIRAIEFAGQLLDVNSLIIGGVVLIQLIAMWALNRRGSGNRPDKSN